MHIAPTYSDVGGVFREVPAKRHHNGPDRAVTGEEDMHVLVGVLIGAGVGIAIGVGTGNLGAGIGVGAGLAVVFGGGAALANKNKVA